MRNDGRAGARLAHAGFTLIEVVIALAIGAVVLLGARLLLTALADDADRIAHSASASAARANGEALLYSLVGRVEVGTATSGQFTGNPQTSHFTTWCDVPEGWQERCTVTLAFERGDSSSVLTAMLPRGRIVLRRSFTSGAFRYLNSPASGGEWFQSWGTAITAPLAIGVILGGDTLIVPIGERG